MVAKLSGLPDEVLKPLLGLACLGNSAEFATLALVQGTSEQQVHADLREAVRLELIERLDSSYRFVHDRVQEAAYGADAGRNKPALHLRIGMALAGANSGRERARRSSRRQPAQSRRYRHQRARLNVRRSSPSIFLPRSARGPRRPIMPRSSISRSRASCSATKRIRSAARPPSRSPFCAPSANSWSVIRKPRKPSCWCCRRVAPTFRPAPR